MLQSKHVVTSMYTLVLVHTCWKVNQYILDLSHFHTSENAHKVAHMSALNWGIMPCTCT